MRKAGRIGFGIRNGDVVNDILVPRYYDPDINQQLEALSSTHELHTIGALIEAGALEMTSGDYIGKINYGTGDIPYIRTSDIRNWELDGTPKHGVSEAVFDRFAEGQDIQEGDVFLVHEGTYLIGTACVLTSHDVKVLYQHHIAKLRATAKGMLNPYLLLALLESDAVQRQIRAKQLTADTIDSIVGRIPEIVLPIPEEEHAGPITDMVRSAVDGRAKSRVLLAKATTVLEEVLASEDAAILDNLSADAEDDALLYLRGGNVNFEGFTIHQKDIREDVIIPKYYDPEEKRALDSLVETCEIRTLQELVEDGIINLDTGHEVGRINYGTGDIPFVRTSDFANWELKTDVKKAVGKRVFDQYSKKQSAVADDILIVRDGTYLVGATTIIQEEDVPLLYCGGIYRLHVNAPDELNPYILFALLNSAVVRRQIQNRRFTRDVIDTLGHRLKEVAIPLPRDEGVADSIGAFFRHHVRARVDARGTIRTAATLVGANDGHLWAG